MSKQEPDTLTIPRVVPTPGRVQALLGAWELEGEVVRMEQEPESGVLIASRVGGELVNPVRVISRGIKLDVPKPLRSSA
jgi:hypothetical protein